MAGDSRTLFLSELEGASLRILETLVEETNKPNASIDAIIGATRLAEGATLKGESKNELPITPAEIRYALGPFVQAGIVGVKAIYDGKKPHNGDYTGPSFGYTILDREEAQKRIPKKEH